MKPTRIILSTDENEDYYPFWPICSKVWTQMFHAPVVLIVISDKPDNDPWINRMKQFGNIIVIPPIAGIPTCNQAKITRSYVASVMEQDTCMLGDIDMIPLNGEWILKQLENVSEDALVCFGKNAYDNTDEAGKFQINFLTGKGSTFKEWLNPTDLSYVELIYRFQHINIPIDGKENVGKLPFSDESLLRYLLRDWDDYEKRLVNVSRPTTIPDHIYTSFLKHYKDRLDRSGDKWVLYDQNISIIDAHCIRPFTKNKEKFAFLLKKLGIDMNQVLL